MKIERREGGKRTRGKAGRFKRRQMKGRDGRGGEEWVRGRENKKG